MNKLNFILVILISIIIINSVPKESAYGFSELVNELNNYIEFEETGVKVEYEVNQNKEEVLEDIKNKFTEKNKSQQCILKDNEISVRTNNELIVADVFEDNMTTLVEIRIINYDSEKSLSNLMKELTELQNNNAKKLKYFQFFKGKIINKERPLNDIYITQKLKNIETLDIHNGYVGTASLNNGQRVNFVDNSYDTGSYFIIGTPIIFATY